MAGVLQGALGGGTLLGMDALEAVLTVIKTEGTGATNVASRVLRAIGTGQEAGVDDMATAIAVAVADGTLTTIDVQILAAVRPGSVSGIEDLAPAIKTLMTA